MNLSGLAGLQKQHGHGHLPGPKKITRGWRRGAGRGLEAWRTLSMERKCVLQGQPPDGYPPAGFSSGLGGRIARCVSLSWEYQGGGGPGFTPARTQHMEIHTTWGKAARFSKEILEPHPTTDRGPSSSSNVSLCHPGQISTLIKNLRSGILCCSAYTQTNISNIN